MIKITDKHYCCGCSACAQSCPKQCIRMREDEEGFLYPTVDAAECIDCGLCEKVCPFLNNSDERKPQSVEVAINPDLNTRLASSSGGVFSLLAEHIIQKGGVVFGARFDSQWRVIHDYTDTIDGLAAFRGSKYVQSEIGSSYKDAKRFLDEGRTVMFTGTPCQINALKRYLKKEYDNLHTVDIVCHGVPSPKIWNDYLRHINPNNEEIQSINMRDKSRSWSKYSYRIDTEKATLYDDYAANSEYLRMYINGFSVRPSCFNCPVKGGRSQSDITLADAWGIKEVFPDMDDEKGASVVCLNSEAGTDLYNAISKESRLFPSEVFYKANPSFHTSAKESQYRTLFWERYLEKGIAAYKDIKEKMKQPLYKRLVHKVLNLFKNEKAY